MASRYQYPVGPFLESVMEFRSTNDQGYTHLKGDLVTNVSSGGVQNSSHGVHLTGGSTGGIVQAAVSRTASCSAWATRSPSTPKPMTPTAKSARLRGLR